MSNSVFDGLSVVSLDGAGLAVQEIEFLEPVLLKNFVTIEDNQLIIPAENSDDLNSSIAVSGITPGDDDDVFQCGRCKLKFSSLALFISHKHEHYQKDKCKKDITDDSSTLKEEEHESGTSLSVRSADGHKGAIEDQTAKRVYMVSKEVLNGKNDEYLDDALPFEPNEEEKFPSEELSSSAIDCQSIVVNEAELFSLTLSGSQVYTLNENLRLSSVGGEKIVDDNNTEIFSSVESLVVETSDQTTETAHVTSSLESAEAVCSTDTQNHDLFHERMAKSSSTNDKKSTKHYCPYCRKPFSKNFDLQQHLRSHTGEKPFQCVVCGRGFAQKSNVKKHILTHKVWPDKTAKAAFGNDLASKTDFAANNESVDELISKEKAQVEDHHICSFCGEIFMTYVELNTHKRLHNDQKVYKCIQKDCKENFNDLEAFLLHIREHDRNVEYRCHVCSKVFTSLHALGFHQPEHSMQPLSKKPNSEYHQCTKCLAKFATVEILTHHLETNSHHFPCGRCSKICVSESMLRRHLRTHSNKLHRCSICLKVLKGITSLKAHLVIHSSKKPFVCHVCQLAFKRNDRLKRHMLIHEDKKFKCPFKNIFGCKREFRRNDKLQLHIITHIKYVSQKGKKTKYKFNTKTGETKEEEEATCNKKEASLQCVVPCAEYLRKELRLNTECISSSGTAVASFSGRNSDSGKKGTDTESITKQSAEIHSGWLDESRLTSVCSRSSAGGEKSDQKWTAVSEVSKHSGCSLEVVPDSEFIITYSSEEEEADPDENRDVEVIYFPLFTGSLDSEFADEESEQSLCDRSQTFDNQIRPDIRTVSVQLDENGSLIVENETGIPLVTSDIDNLNNLNSSILINQSRLSVLDETSKELYEPGSLNSVEDHVDL